MIELPEAVVLARQINAALVGQVVAGVTAGASPHKNAWFHGKPAEYSKMLLGRTVETASAVGGFVKIIFGDKMLVFAEGMQLRYYEPEETNPEKHQLILDFLDGSRLLATVQMYGGLWCCDCDQFDNPYYQMALAKPSPLTDPFDWTYFSELLHHPTHSRLRAKAFLATEQRIPGLGNGVLQDILYAAQIHPKRKMESLTESEQKRVFVSITEVLQSMEQDGGRNTEKDLFGNPGGYQVKMGKTTVGQSCTVCGVSIVKEAFLGGSIYFCPTCQSIPS